MLFVLRLISANQCNCWMDDILRMVKNSLSFIMGKQISLPHLHEVKYVSFALVVQKQHIIQKYHIIMQVKSLHARMFGVKVSFHVFPGFILKLLIYFMSYICFFFLSKKCFRRNLSPCWINSYNLTKNIYAFFTYIFLYVYWHLSFSTNVQSILGQIRDNPSFYIPDHYATKTASYSKKSAHLQEFFPTSWSC